MFDLTPPDYLRETYGWAYLTPWSARLLDRQWVVQLILWGNADRLMARTLDLIEEGEEVLQPASVYGNFSARLAERIGCHGRLTLRDIAPLQLELARRKLAHFSQVRIEPGNAARPSARQFHKIVCFFLLHEVPDREKCAIIAALLGQLRPGGKAIFVDYHRPHRRHPLAGLMNLIFRRLEPYAASLLERDIETMAGPGATLFQWRKTTLFGGLYQIVTAERS